MVSFWCRLRMRMSGAVSVEAGMVTGISFGIAPFLPFYMLGNSLSSCSSWRVIVVIGPVVCYGMVGFLV